jgi:hypothetical protein
MANYPNHGCGRIGRRIGLLCAGLGLLTAYLMLKLIGFWNAPMFGLNAAMVFGVLVLFVVSGFFGTKAGVYLCWQGNRTGLNISIGLLLALGSIVIPVWAGCVFYIFFHDPNQIIEVKQIPAILISPLLVILIFGGIPAAVLGVVYGLLTGMQLDKLDQLKFAEVHKV